MSKNIDFVVIDFETANSNRSSACSLGYSIVENGEIVNSDEYLIKPEPFYFDSYNTYLHGIDEDMVSDKPNIVEVWNSTYNLFKDKLVVAHNASFDISVLRYGFDQFETPYPQFNYICTYKLSQKTWPNEINYKLNTLADKFDISFDHHNAKEDTIATAKILIECLKHNNVDSITDLLDKFDLKYGKLFNDNYKPFSLKSSSSNMSKVLVPNTQVFDEDNIFFEKKVIFTGTLNSMSRKEASQKILDIGGILGNGVTKDTDFLVLGEQDYRHLADGSTISSKMKKAYKYHDDGTGIQIISENDFLQMLNS